MLRRNILFSKTVVSMPQVPAFAHISNNEDINYLCNVNSDINFNCSFVLDRKVIVYANETHLVFLLNSRHQQII